VITVAADRRSAMTAVWQCRQGVTALENARSAADLRGIHSRSAWRVSRAYCGILIGLIGVRLWAMRVQAAWAPGWER
jgi:hypothetical protein